MVYERFYRDPPVQVIDYRQAEGYVGEIVLPWMDERDGI